MYTKEQVREIAQSISSLRNPIFESTGGLVLVSKVARTFSTMLFNAHNGRFDEEEFLVACGLHPEGAEVRTHLARSAVCECGDSEGEHPLGGPCIAAHDVSFCNCEEFTPMRVRV